MKVQDFYNECNDTYEVHVSNLTLAQKQALEKFLQAQSITICVNLENFILCENLENYELRQVENFLRTLTA